MNPLKFIFVSFSLLPVVSSLDLKFLGSPACNERLPVSLNFSTLCNEESLCALGAQQFVEGSIVYKDLVGTFNATQNDHLYVGADLEFSISGHKTYDRAMLALTEIPVCGANNKNGDCPADGTYSFQANYTFPDTGNALYDWARSGYKGEIVLSVYYDNKNNLAGQCTLQVETRNSGSYEIPYTVNGKRIKRKLPNGRIGAITAICALAAIVSCMCLCRICRSSKVSAKQEGLMPDQDVEKYLDRQYRLPATTYKRSYRR